MKRYFALNGYWDDGKVFVEEGAVVRPLPLHLDVRRHSPTGFAWGYSGSGPSQLALAILCDLIGPYRAQRYYQLFRDAAISGLDQQTGWSLSEAEVREAVRWARRVMRGTPICL